jgi:hypothetical protein
LKTVFYGAEVKAGEDEDGIEAERSLRVRLMKM